jgi:uncharacterized protein (DUF2384 family)
MAWTVKMDKDFIGKAGLEKQKADGAPRQLVCLVCQAEDADPWGYNPIFSGDRIVGMTSSGGTAIASKRASHWGTYRRTWQRRGHHWRWRFSARKSQRRWQPCPCTIPKMSA